MSKVSIIIPNLNDTTYLEQLLCQLENYSPAVGWEVIVVDGGSAEFPGTIIDKVDQLLVSRAGRAVQLNTGIARSSGSLLWLLHADSCVNAEVCRAVEEMSEYGVSSGETVWGRFDIRFAVPSGVMSKRLSLIAYFMNLRSRATGICTGDQGIFVERTLLEKIGGVPDQKLMEDIEMSRRLKSICSPECRKEYLYTSPRRWQKTGIIRTVIFMWAMRAAYYFGVNPNRLAKAYYGPSR